MTRYHCTSCGHDFEHSGRKLRCPECLRQNGLEEVGAESARDKRKSKKRGGPNKLLIGVTVLTLAALIGAGALWSFKSKAEVPKPGELGVLDAELLKRTLKKRGIPDADALDPFTYGPALTKLLGDLPGGSGAAQAKAIAAKLAPVLAPLKVDTSGSERQPVRMPEELATDLADKSTKVTSLTSYEAAMLLTAALRKAGQAALLAEVFELDAPMRSADASMVGRFAVAVYDKDQLGKKPLIVLDPARAAKLPRWAGGGGDAAMTSKAKKWTPLDDATAVAYLYALRALREINENPKAPERAYELSLRGLTLAHRSATIHVIRALVLLKAGQAAALTEALEQARKGQALRPDAPRQTLVAQLTLLSRDVQGAEKLLEKAIKADKTYWPAYILMATVRWMQQDREGGRKWIDKAVAVAPGAGPVMALQAAQLMQDGEDAKALVLLRKAEKVTPKPQIQLQLYQALAKADLGKEARALRKRMLANTPHKKLLTEQLEKIDLAMGFDPDDTGDDDGDKDDGDKGDGDDDKDGDKDDKPKLLPGMKLPDVKLAPPSGLDKPFKLPDVKLTP